MNRIVRQVIRNFFKLLIIVSLTGIQNPLLAACKANLVAGAAGTIKDQASGLLWSRCLLGQSAGNCGGSPAAATWVDTLNQARGSELGGITQWRMPKIEEIERLFATTPDCLAEVFPGFRGAVIWSASANIDYATDAWGFEVETGKRMVYARDSKLHALLVANSK